MPILAAAGIALTLGSTLMSMKGIGDRAEHEAQLHGAQADLFELAGRRAYEGGVVKAGRIRRAGAADVSAIAPEYASAGVASSSKSAREVTGEVSRRVELDAIGAILEGKYAQEDYSIKADLERRGAKNVIAEGRSAQRASLLAGIGKSLGFMGGFGGGGGGAGGPSFVDAGTPSFSSVA